MGKDRRHALHDWTVRILEQDQVVQHATAIEPPRHWTREMSDCRAEIAVEPNGGPKPTELGIRPEHLRPDGTGDAALEGEVITIERLGAESYMYVDIGQEEPLVVKAEAAVPTRHGERARIGIPAAAMYLFAADGSCIERQAFH